MQPAIIKVRYAVNTISSLIVAAFGASKHLLDKDNSIEHVSPVSFIIIMVD